jgi:hypothetical protein
MSAPRSEIARSAASRASDGVRSIRTFAFSEISRAAAAKMIAATTSAAIESPCANPARTTSRPTSTASEPAMSPAKCRALARNAGLP